MAPGAIGDASANWRVKPASQVAAVARASDKLDIFIIGKEGGVWTAAWEKSGGWNAWKKVANGRAAPGSSIAAVSRAPTKLDIFIVGAKRTVREPSELATSSTTGEFE